VLASKADASIDAAWPGFDIREATGDASVTLRAVGAISQRP
jgi:hypothetical protein